MQRIADRDQCRATFLHALQLLGRAASRLALGAPDPLLCGAVAVELYMGSLWSAAELEVQATEARPLNAALMAVGFRWTGASA